MADPARGRFRTFLLTSLRTFLAETHRHATRLKRGGGQFVVRWEDLTADQRYLSEPRDESTAETLFEERWAVTLLEAVLTRLREELTTAGKEQLFSELKDQLWGGPTPVSYTELSSRLNLSEGALKVTVHRLRRRFRELLREEVGHTVANPAEIDEELRHLVAAVRRWRL